MGALVVIYIVGSFVAIPVLAFQLVRTRRDLKALRDALLAQGVIVRGPEGTREAFAAPPDEPHALAPGAHVAPEGVRAERVAPAEPPRPEPPRPEPPR
jgi:hypothetical protein